MSRLQENPYLFSTLDDLDAHRKKSGVISYTAPPPFHSMYSGMFQYLHQ